jgi:hypothetical protein
MEKAILGATLLFVPIENMNIRLIVMSAILWMATKEYRITSAVQVWIALILFGAGLDSIFIAVYISLWAEYKTALVAVWGSSFILPLDWQVWYQKWPIPAMYAAAIGGIIEAVCKKMLK